jgi:hypothetical protein
VYPIDKRDTALPSNIRAFLPARAAYRPAVKPAGPLPMITISVWMFFIVGAVSVIPFSYRSKIKNIISDAGRKVFIQV